MLIHKFDVEPVCCAVCRRAAVGFGYAPRQGKPVAWLCDEPDCLTLGKTVFHMPRKHLSQYEAFSLHEAGQEAGAYLESIDKFNLADLTEEEWIHFLKIVLNAFGENMRSRLLSHAAPF
ncbi:hypothetical protein PMNALOAF_2713 [Methylobacterium adhaesivum]|uniref:DUF6511 domain-containing protein n=1 Tax=Methylobacterium adhaesivum TaxID=333297 RepID=A0ABT8BIT2_9HYPH|nr:DUF6511 domain-containing protein [Methylobacterium adhaesivum]MDN3592067.1 DUF6511 domain-containing protein [Methylobacterium adhaesivum]GJD31454.1 hypothetical protein PMNALOAF_2713 [Methylobacterium adhaesivum]